MLPTTHRLDVIGIDPQSGGDALAVLAVALAEVPDHPLLDVAVALLEVSDQVLDELLALPVRERTVAFAGLLVVVLPAERLAPNRPGDVGPVRGRRLGRLAQPARLLGS